MVFIILSIGVQVCMFPIDYVADVINGIQGINCIMIISLCSVAVCCGNKQISTSRFTEKHINILSLMHLIIGAINIICFILSLILNPNLSMDFPTYYLILTIYMFSLSSLHGLFSNKQMYGLQILIVFLVFSILACILSMVIIVVTCFGGIPLIGMIAACMQLLETVVMAAFTGRALCGTPSPVADPEQADEQQAEENIYE